MDENESVSLDLEFKRYLQLLRPYVGQLVDENIIKICNAWIQRLSNCKDDEKAMRNKYIFLLCYQLGRGVLDSPFLQSPPTTLNNLSDDINSDDSSTEIEYMVINSDEPKTKVLFDSKKLPSETDYLSQEDDKMWSEVVKDHERPVDQGESQPSHQQTFLCYNCPEVMESDYRRNNGEGYERRAHNLIKKLREIKMQNVLLHKELMALKEVSQPDDVFRDTYAPKVDNATSPFAHSNASNATLNSLKCRLQDIQDSRNTLIQTISNLQDQLDNLNELKRNQIEDIEAKHKLELIKVRTDTREESKALYEKKLNDVKLTYEETIAKIQETAKNEINAVTKSKDEIVFQKNSLLEAKDKEIESLKIQIEDQKLTVHSMMSKFMEKSAEDASYEGLRIKNQLLEKRLNKIEKSKIKCSKMYEAKIAQLQREKHLTECSLQLQLVRQRAQVVSELTDENQTELTTSLDKLENKYKDIVANVQATAIQRRMQDQKVLESILQTAYGVDDNNQSHYSNPVRRYNQTYDTVNSSLACSNRAGNIVLGNKSYGDESLVNGFCLNGERMGELFQRVYIPQKDNGETK